MNPFNFTASQWSLTKHSCEAEHISIIAIIVQLLCRCLYKQVEKNTDTRFDIRLYTGDQCLLFFTEMGVLNSVIFQSQDLHISL